MKLIRKPLTKGSAVDWTVSDKNNLLWKSYSLEDDLPIWSVALPDELNWMDFEYQLEGTPSEIFIEVASWDCWAVLGEENSNVVKVTL